MYGYKTGDTASQSSGYSLLGRTPSESLLNMLEELDKLPKNSYVLNLGCGDGILEGHAAKKRHYSFTSIDIEPAAINTTSKIILPQHHEHDDLIIGDITKLGEIERIKGKQYDAAVLWRVLHGISPKYYSGIFEQVHSLLKFNSSFFVSVASDKDWKAKALGDTYQPKGVNDCSGIMFRDYGIERFTPFPVHFFSQKELIGLGEAAGFSIVASHLFQESSGYSHLQDKQNTYLLVEFASTAK